jgi:hypothetical protein
VTTTSGTAVGKQTLSGRAFVVWLIILTLAVLLLYPRWHGFGVVAVVWALQLIAMWRRGAKERAVLAEGEQLLAESRAADQARKRELLTRLVRRVVDS